MANSSLNVKGLSELNAFLESLPLRMQNNNSLFFLWFRYGKRCAARVL